MRKKGGDSKVNLALTVLLVFIVCFLSFSVGVISGKGWSDREHDLAMIEDNTQFAKQTVAGQQEVSPLSQDMTAKEVDLLARKALEEARKDATTEQSEADAIVAELEQTDRLEKVAQGIEPDEEKSGSDDVRRPTSIPLNKPTPTVPKPDAIEWTVQVAAYYTETEAADHSQRLVEKGFPAFPYLAEINGKKVYRVVIGSFKTKREAVKYRQDISNQAVVKSSFVQRITR